MIAQNKIIIYQPYSRKQDQFTEPQRVYEIECDGCFGFIFERNSVDEARFFAASHNEEVHGTSLTIEDQTNVSV